MNKYNPDKPEKLICNKCGKTCMKGNLDIGGDIEDPYGLLDVVYVGGYFSHPTLKDMMIYHFSVCEECLAEFMGTFKISPEVGWYDDELEAKYFPENVKNTQKAKEVIAAILTKKPNKDLN